jgi:hypothetical protein
MKDSKEEEERPSPDGGEAGYARKLRKRLNDIGARRVNAERGMDELLRQIEDMQRKPR